MKRKYVFVILWLLVIIILSLMPKSSIGIERVKLFKNADKIVHFFMYFILTVLLVLAFKKGKVCKPFCLLIISFFAVSLGVLMEFLQKYLDIGRSFDTFDILANTTGVIFVIIFLNNKIVNYEF